MFEDESLSGCVAVMMLYDSHLNVGKGRRLGGLDHLERFGVSRRHDGSSLGRGGRVNHGDVGVGLGDDDLDLCEGVVDLSLVPCVGREERREKRGEERICKTY